MFKSGSSRWIRPENTDAPGPGFYDPHFPEKQSYPEFKKTFSTKLFCENFKTFLNLTDFNFFFKNSSEKLICFQTLVLSVCHGHQMATCLKPYIFLLISYYFYKLFIIIIYFNYRITRMATLHIEYCGS